MPAPTKSKPVLITGCSTGIGRATAEQLAGKGWNVYATARKLDAIEDLKAAGCKTLALDVTDEKSMASPSRRSRSPTARSGRSSTTPATARAAQSRRSRWTACAGSSRPTSSAWCACASWSSRACASAGEGRIVNISSMGGKLVFPGGGAYHATKFSVEAISDALRWEVKDFGVGVVIIEPGLITTEFGETAHASIDANEETGPYAKFNSDGREGRRPRSTRGR